MIEGRAEEKDKEMLGENAKVAPSEAKDKPIVDAKMKRVTKAKPR